MGSVKKYGSDDEYSVIKEKGEIGFIDYANDLSVQSYDQNDEGPVLVSVPFPFIRGKPRSVLIGETSKSSITIENTTSEPVELGGVRIYSSQPEDSFTLSLMEPPSENSNPDDIRGFVEAFFIEDRVLQPNETLTVWLSCKPKDIGVQTSVVHFDMDYDRIERVVFLLAENKVCQSMSSRKPYKRVSRKPQFAVDEYVGSSRPKGKAKGSRPYMHRLPEFPIPKTIREQVGNKQIPNVLTECLTGANYEGFFSTLLVLEELQLEEDMRCHNMEGVAMKRKGPNNLALEVPGLAERRPSLVHGDHVFAKLALENGDPGTVYQGYIHRVEADEVLLKFTGEFHTSHHHRNLYNVQFTYNRLNMRRLYNAVYATVNLEADLLFPSHLTKRRLVKPTTFVPFTCNLNKEQRRCVEMILACNGAPPFVIYGPPGTGKTSTLVEAILQVYTKRERYRVLVCAASNSAADHILERIIGIENAGVKENEIFRMNAPSRSYDDVQPDHIRFCCFNEESAFKCPPLNALARYRIIISTYMSSSLLYVEGVKCGHFSHIFLDEAGQASEPECMVPISTLCNKETVIVLAGDPKQLGPVVFSKKADSLGLGKSYLERLFECEHYNHEDERFIIKLVRNYRSHPAILDLPSKLFYKGELLACKEDLSSSRYENFDFLPNKNFPVLFFGIQGCDEREGNNPSWFNRIEAGKVVDIISKLIENADLNEADIGVITPYRQQVFKIRQVLEAYGFQDIKVGSVEQFQGQEREVIIVSTVRSTIKHNEFDKIYCLGFLSHPRRFNVAITRAKSLLVIVGNPHIVCQDPYWDKLLKYCTDNNSYLGCPPPEREDDEDQELALPGLDIEVQDPYSKVETWRQSVQSTSKVSELIVDDAEWV